MGTIDKLFDGSAAHELCSACGGTGRVYEGEICKFCEHKTELARLQAEVERLTSQVKWMTDERTDLRAELEKLRADAGRWHLILAEHNRFDPVLHVVAKVHFKRNESEWVNIADLNATIDALRAEGDERE